MTEKPRNRTSGRTSRKAKDAARKEALNKLIGWAVSRSLVARYDALQMDPTRKQPEIRTDASWTEQQFRAEYRIKSYVLCDNLYQNTSIGPTIDTSIKMTVGRRGGTPLFTGPDKDFAQAFYNDWKRHCGYDEGEGFQEMLEQILRIVKVHGDCVCWLDPVLTGGKLRVFDADQICSVSLTDFDLWKREHGLPEHCRQVEGAVVGGDGKVYGYWVTMLRNRYSVSIEDALFLPIGTCRRVSYHKMHSQYRGEPAILANLTLTEDTKELLKSEVQSAKLASELPLIVEQPEGLDADKMSGMLSGFDDMNDLTDGTGVSPDDLTKLVEAATVDETKVFNAFEGKASIANVKAGTHVTNLNNAARPSQPIQSWVDVLNDANGRLMGVMSLFSRGRADNSYSSGMIEIGISQRQFEADQKMLERNVIDYCMEQLLPNSEYEVYWDRAMQVDPEKYEKTVDMQLRGGRTTYREVLGADWKATLVELAEEKKWLKSIGLDNLSIFQTSSGQEVTEVIEEHTEENTDNGEN